MIILSKNETKQLEYDTIRIENLMQKSNKRVFLHSIFFEILGWYHTHNLKANCDFKKQISKLSELFKSRPTYHKNSNGYKYAIWGLSWNNNRFILYKSLKGIQIQVLEPFFDIEDFLIHLKRVLCK
ncbi:MAG: hypothetical protein M0R17_03155 [Candidatus Omnitrophica bacterium]|jgi:hypothetical protein|nr:hypothetical protein [Candidatus Omnitrophota bacterium]